MNEQINNLSEMVVDYYTKNDINNMVFDFLHIKISYTYIDLNSRLIDVDNNGIPAYNNGKKNISEMIIVPVVLKKDDYNKLFANDDNYEKRTFVIPNSVDAGTSYNFNYGEIYKQINKIIPRGCHMISDAEMMTIAKINGYEKIYWDIQDENDSVLKDYELEPNWVVKVYAIKKLEEQKTNTK